MDALETYRQIQAELRRLFDPLTSQLCPACSEPCCRVPTRVTPGDVALAEACGWAPPEELGMADPMQAVATQSFRALLADEPGSEPRPCPFLGKKGCAFPPDLRPYGCTIYVCRPMLRKLTAKGRNRLRRLVAALEHEHARLIARTGAASDLRNGRLRPQRRPPASGGITNP